MTRVKLCGADEIELGTVMRFEPAESPLAVALASCEGGLRAVVDNCSHEDYALSEGELFPDTCELECLKHGSTFSLIDGEPLSLPATKPVTVLPVEIIDGEVWVELP